MIAHTQQRCMSIGAAWRFTCLGLFIMTVLAFPQAANMTIGAVLYAGLRALEYWLGAPAN